MEKSLKGQGNDNKVIKSTTLKAGKKTYFFDVKVASNNSKYLKVTESTFEGENQPRKYNSFVMFPETVISFTHKLNEVVESL